MKRSIAYVDGRTIHTYKSKKGLCDCNCDEPDLYIDETTGEKFIIGVNNGQLFLEPYVDPKDKQDDEGEASDVVGTAIVGQSKAA